jgi:glucose/mannose transport system permease protein
MNALKRFSKYKDQWIAIFVLLPSLILLAIFVYGFIFQTGYNSLTDWRGIGDPSESEFVGLENYRKLFTGLLEIRFRQSLVNTLFFTIFFIAGCLSLGLLFAILIDQGIRFEGFFRMIFLYPMSLSFIVTGTVWNWLLNPVGGINLLPTLFGQDPWQFKWIASRKQIFEFDWQNIPTFFGVALLLFLIYISYHYWKEEKNIPALITSGISIVTLIWLLSGGAEQIQILKVSEMHGFNLAMVGIILAAIWQMSGYMMAMYLAGIRGIAEELREAARVDGASELQIYFQVIFPLLTPITLSAMIVLGHISLKIFDLIYVMAGPDNATTDVPGILMFMTSFRGNEFAKGAAIAIVMLIMVAIIIVPYLTSTLKSEQEL